MEKLINILRAGWSKEPTRLNGGSLMLGWLTLQLVDDELVTVETLIGLAVIAVTVYLTRNGWRLPTQLGGSGHPIDPDGMPGAPDGKGGVWAPETVRRLFYVDGHDGPPPPNRT